MGFTSFNSRKNEVILKDENIVVKSFKDTERFQTEFQTLTLLDGFYSPRILKTGIDFIEMQYIPGDLLLDKYLSADKEQAIRLGHILASTVKNLYVRLGQKIPFDENFRNYIFFQDIIFRVDFEETQEGKIEDWAAKILSFAILYDAEIQAKAEFINSFLKTLKISPKEIYSRLNREIIFLSDRWGKVLDQTDYPYLEKTIFMKE
ncbi:MAG: hypothetical protein GXY10_03970 [Clostridiales bacterium]|jgi:hypothetical protein|nr:hypothetical protein [Clostridiales bacterium]